MYIENSVKIVAENGNMGVAISSAGKSKNIIRGVDAGRKTGCQIITMSGFKPNNPLRSKGELNFYVPSDSYGYVEIAHLILCHSMVDIIVDRKQIKLQPA